MIRLAVIGSREGFLGDPGTFIENLIKLERIKKEDLIIVSGGARGVDSQAEAWADKEGVKKLIFLADWKGKGKGAGYIRNHDIIENSDLVLAIWNGESRGTLHSLTLAKKKGLKIYLTLPELHIAKDNEIPDKLTFKTT
jgi:hypothetical protein